VALTACGECNREISTLAKTCPGCGAPAVIPEPTPTVQQEAALPPPGTARYDKRITERLITEKSLEEVRAIVGSRFAQIQPKFSVETLSYKNSQMESVRVSINPMEGGYLMAVDHNYPPPTSSHWGTLFEFVGFGLIWYFLNIWVALGALVLGLILMANQKFTFGRIEECINNLKNEIA